MCVCVCVCVGVHAHTTSSLSIHPPVDLQVASSLLNSAAMNTGVIPSFQITAFSDKTFPFNYFLNFIEVRDVSINTLEFIEISFVTLNKVNLIKCFMCVLLKRMYILYMELQNSTDEICFLKTIKFHTNFCLLDQFPRVH